MEKGWSISEAAAATGFSMPTLRFYEQEGLIPPVPRDGAGKRCYGDEQRARLNTIRCLHAAGLSLGDMKRYLSLFKEKSEEDRLRTQREILLHTREKVQKHRRELQRCLNYLGVKLRYYDEAIDAVKNGKVPPQFNLRLFAKFFPHKGNSKE